MSLIVDPSSITFLFQFSKTIYHHIMWLHNELFFAVDDKPIMQSNKSQPSQLIDRISFFLFLKHRERNVTIKCVMIGINGISQRRGSFSRGQNLFCFSIVSLTSSQLRKFASCDLIIRINNRSPSGNTFHIIIVSVLRVQRYKYTSHAKSGSMASHKINIYIQ